MSIRLSFRRNYLPLAFIWAVLIAVPITSPEASNWQNFINIPLPTMGGKQVWADLHIAGGWRIQQNVLTGHYRLLDEKNVRHAWGDYKNCSNQLDEARKAGKVRPNSEPFVLLVHGIARSTGTFSKMVSRLRLQGYDAQAISYPSTRRSISDHADQLETLLQKLDGIEKVSFVTHSMGGLVVRELLSRNGNWRKKIDVERLVMIAPPNQGSAVARYLKDYALYKLLYGPAGQELTPGGVVGIPGLNSIEFGIIAGGRGNGNGFNPLLPGDDDGTVTVIETKLANAADHYRVDSIHAKIANNLETIIATMNFLKNGKFNLSGKK